MSEYHTKPGSSETLQFGLTTTARVTAKPGESAVTGLLGHTNKAGRGALNHFNRNNTPNRSHMDMLLAVGWQATQARGALGPAAPRIEASVISVWLPGLFATA